MRPDLRAKTEHKPAISACSQIPGGVGERHRGPRERDSYRGTESEIVPAVGGDSKGEERIVLRL